MVSMRRLIGVFVVALAAFAVMAPGASAQAPENGTVVEECTSESILLGTSCVIVYECPEAAESCEASGFVHAAAFNPTGIIHADVHVASPPIEDEATIAAAECGFPDSIVRVCGAFTDSIPVAAGDEVHVACASNRKLLSLGILTHELLCEGTFVVNE